MLKTVVLVCYFKLFLPFSMKQYKVVNQNICVLLNCEEPYSS